MKYKYSLIGNTNSRHFDGAHVPLSSSIYIFCEKKIVAAIVTAANVIVLHSDRIAQVKECD
jgi:hypothetical protein